VGKQTRDCSGTDLDVTSAFVELLACVEASKKNVAATWRSKVCSTKYGTLLLYRCISSSIHVHVDVQYFFSVNLHN